MAAANASLGDLRTWTHHVEIIFVRYLYFAVTASICVTDFVQQIFSQQWLGYVLCRPTIMYKYSAGKWAFSLLKPQSVLAPGLTQTSVLWVVGDISPGLNLYLRVVNKSSLSSHKVNNECSYINSSICIRVWCIIKHWKKVAVPPVYYYIII